MKIILDSVQDAFNFVVKVGSIDLARSFWAECSNDSNSYDYLIKAIAKIEDLKTKPDLKITLSDVSKCDYDNHEVLVVPFGGDLSNAYIERFSSLGGKQVPVKFGEESFTSTIGKLANDKIISIMDTISLRNKQIKQIEGL